MWGVGGGVKEARRDTVGTLLKRRQQTDGKRISRRNSQSAMFE